MPRSSKWSLPFRFSNQNIICISHISHACYMPRLLSPSFDHPYNIRWRVIGLRMEETTSRYGVLSIGGQPRRGGSPALALSEGANNSSP
jgi:hypothetical protein